MKIKFYFAYQIKTCTKEQQNKLTVNMKYLILLVSIFSCALSRPSSSKSDINCSGQPDHTFIRDPTDCKAFFVCNHGLAFGPQFCPGDKLTALELIISSHGWTNGKLFPVLSLN